MNSYLTRRTVASLVVAGMLVAPGAAVAQRLSSTLARNPIVLHHAGRVLDFAFAPNGGVLATTTNNSQSVTLWNPKTGQVMRTLSVATRAAALAFSVDGAWLAVSEQSGAVTLWNTQTWTRVTGALIPPLGPNPGLAFGWLPARTAPPPSPLNSGKGKAVLAAWFGGEVRVFEITASATSRPLYTLACSNTPPDPTDPYVPRVHTVRFARNGLRVATVCDHRVTVWDAATGGGSQPDIVPAPLVEDAAFSADSRLLAFVRQASGDSPQVQVRNLALSSQYTFQPPPPLPSEGFYATDFSPDGSTLAAGQWQTGSIVLWNVATRAAIRTLSGHFKYVTRLQYSPDGTLLASGGGPDSTVRLWRMR